MITLNKEPESIFAVLQLTVPTEKNHWPPGKTALNKNSIHIAYFI